jgi:hypothetical protein
MYDKKVWKKYYETHKEQRKKDRKIYYQENIDLERKKALENYYKNKEQQKQYSKNYSLLHKEERKFKRKIYLENNKDKIKIKRKEYYEKTKEEKKIWRKEYIKLNKEKIKERTKEYNKSFKGLENRIRYNNSIKGQLSNVLRWEKRRAIKSQAIQLFTINEWHNKLRKCKGFCPICNQHSKLELDHTYPLIKGYKDYINELKKGYYDAVPEIYTIEDVEPMCRFCNLTKGAS